MDDILIYLEGEETPYKVYALIDKIINEGTAKAPTSFIEFQRIHEYQLSLPHMDKEARIRYAKVAIAQLKPTYQNSIPKTYDEVKAQLSLSLLPILVRENDKNILYRTRYDLQVSGITFNIMYPQKLNYFSEIIAREDLNINKQNFGKIKWLRGVAEFGFMISLLEKKGYIELPVGSNAEGAYEKLAKILFETFDVTDSWTYIKDVLNPERNRLSETKRAKLNAFPDDLPQSAELGSVKARKKKN